MQELFIVNILVGVAIPILYGLVKISARFNKDTEVKTKLPLRSLREAQGHWRIHDIVLIHINLGIPLITRVYAIVRSSY